MWLAVGLGHETELDVGEPVGVVDAAVTVVTVSVTVLGLVGSLIVGL